MSGALRPDGECFVRFDLREMDRVILLSTPELELGWSREDGSLVLLRAPDGPSILGHGPAQAALDVALDTPDGWVSRRSFARFLWHRATPCADGVEVLIAIGLGPLKIVDTYHVTPGLVTRQAMLENVGLDDLRVCGLRLALPNARVGDPARCCFEAPGNSARPHVPLAVAAAQRRDVLPRRFFAPGLRGGSALEPAPSQGSGLLVLHDDSLPAALLCWYAGGADVALPYLQGRDGATDAVTLVHEVGLSGWVRPGERLASGAQRFLISDQGWPAALEQYRAAESATPVGRAGWLADAVIYTTHPAHHGGLRGLAGDLSRLGDLGCDTLILLPLCHSGRDPHSLYDLEQIDPALGNKDDLRDLMTQAHDQGMRVLLDLALQGCAAESRYVAERPDWFLRDEAGAFVIGQPPVGPAVNAHPGVRAAAGRYQLDWQNPDLQEYFLSWAVAQVHDLGLDGFRAVEPYSPAVAWARRGPAHASAGGLAPLSLLQRMRVALRAVSPEIALLSTLGGPAYAAVSDGCYDYLAHHMFFHMALSRVTPAELRDYLDDARQARGNGTAAICFVESHDTSSINPLADGLRGSRLSRMLLAGMLFCGFTPALWSGQERGEEPFLRALLGLWHAEPALRRGEALYGAARCDTPDLFLVPRERAGRCLLGLLNVGPHERAARINLPEGWAANQARDLLGWSNLVVRSAPNNQLQVVIEPFGCGCIAF